MAGVAAVWRLERCQTCVEEEDLFVGIGDECRTRWKGNGPVRDARGVHFLIDDSDFGSIGSLLTC